MSGLRPGEFSRVDKALVHDFFNAAAPDPKLRGYHAQAHAAEGEALVAAEPGYGELDESIPGTIYDPHFIVPAIC
eukprot:CAMPEP_0185620014 /NCGR_PEP_ID=MMETSP0436-20130131/52607_1 /TAXON_ID=626734 ORGANISM="Favella taraikaensis, Strain Fe Narragansett Bay" /NCGR_SAMPLE_ID=MMETSP0436 /ASSEMBLY_ACC=CAM_ASM_000390 /LENGTH=74 /DNA_ID=CAMNT_0028260007 /DNA_START=389 /DNA_END=613 /DNA_ORIENTATION=+